MRTRTKMNTSSTVVTPDRLTRAKGYPYNRPTGSFCFLNGKSYGLQNAHWEGVRNLSDLVLDTGAGSESLKSLLQRHNMGTSIIDPTVGTSQRLPSSDPAQPIACRPPLGVH